MPKIAAPLNLSKFVFIILQPRCKIDRPMPIEDIFDDKLCISLEKQLSVAALSSH